jgi:hypothetical protein
MKQIRQVVFETNSSSTHSICIAKDATLTIPESLHFEFEGFGWECSEISSLQSKANYLYTGLINEERQEDADKIIQFLKDKGIEVTAEEPIFIKKSYTNSLGKLVEYNEWQNAEYIDHSGELSEFLDDICNDENKLINYLFSDLSFIITGNDNDDEDININVSYAYDEYFKGN